MTWEEFLAFYQKRSRMILDIPAKIQNEEELRKLYDDPKVRQRFEKAEKYRTVMEQKKQIETEMVRNTSLDSNLNRFKIHYYDVSGTPEADELNRDFTDMLFCAEGETLLAEMTLGDVLNADYSIIYPKDIDEAIDLTVAHPGQSEKMMTIMKATESNKNYELNPTAQEFFKYHLGAMEDAEVAFGSLNFYAYKWGNLLRPEMSMVDYALLIGGMKKDTSDKELMDMQVHMNQMFRFSDENAPYAKAQELREQGIIGPESKYYRAYNEQGEQIRFDHAVGKYAAGEKVEFRKMSPEEQKQLDRALAHPVSIKEQPKIGALSGDGLKEEFRALYEKLQSAESMFRGSSTQFKNIKKALKAVSEMKEPLSEEHAKKFLRQWVPAAGKYLNDKVELRNNLKAANSKFEYSNYVQNRINAMTDVFGSLSKKLGYLAYNDYRVRVKDRTLAENRQKLITDSVLRNQQANSDLVAQTDLLKQNLENVRPSTAGTAFRNLTKQAIIAGEGLAKNLRTPGIGNEPKIRDTAFNDGRYLSMLVAYSIVKEERIRLNGADYEKKNEDPVAGPMEVLLNKVGSHAFYKAVQNTALMQHTVENGITPQKVRSLILNHGEREFVEKLSKPACLEEIKKNAEAYKAAQDAKKDPALGENLKINN